MTITVRNERFAADERAWISLSEHCSERSVHSQVAVTALGCYTFAADILLAWKPRYANPHS